MLTCRIVRTTLSWPLISVCCGLLILFDTCQGQTDGASPRQASMTSPLRTGSIELGLMGGNAIDGLARADIPLANFVGFRVASSGTGLLSLNVAVAIKPNLLFFGQIAALKGKHERRPLSGGYSAETNLLNVLYEGGFEYIFPPKKRLSPYLLVSGATVQKRIDTLVNFVNLNPFPPEKEPLAGATRVRLTRAVFAVAGGGGLRYYFTRHFGLRFELKSYFPTTDVRTPFAAATAGIFIVFN